MTLRVVHEAHLRFVTARDVTLRIPDYLHEMSVHIGFQQLDSTEEVTTRELGGGGVDAVTVI